MDEREIYNKAFSLLHSQEENSGKNLRLMLDSMIQEKCGFQKTVTQRLSRTFLNKAERGQFFFLRKFDNFFLGSLN